MARLTIAQLSQQLEAAHVSYQRMEQRAIAAEEKLAVADREIGSLSQQLNELRGPRIPRPSFGADANKPAVRVFEFDPRIAGDFKRASELARANFGRVQRMRVGV